MTSSCMKKSPTRMPSLLQPRRDAAMAADGRSPLRWTTVLISGKVVEIARRRWLFLLSPRKGREKELGCHSSHSKVKVGRDGDVPARHGDEGFQEQITRTRPSTPSSFPNGPRRSGNLEAGRRSSEEARPTRNSSRISLCLPARTASLSTSRLKRRAVPMGIPWRNCMKRAVH